MPSRKPIDRAWLLQATLVCSWSFAVVAVLALLGAGTGVVLASVTMTSRSGGGPSTRQPPLPLVTSGGGTEVGADGAAYGIEIRKDDGSVVGVNLDENFKVKGAESDEDGPSDSDRKGDD